MDGTDQLPDRPNVQNRRSTDVEAFVGARYYADKPSDGPEWGLRFGLTFLFP